jgi:hypothetical protein
MENEAALSALLRFQEEIYKTQYDLRLAAKILPGIISVVVFPEIVTVIITPEIVPGGIISAVIDKGTRRYNHNRPSPKSRHPGAVLPVISIHPDVTWPRTGGPHDRNRRRRAETNTD